MSVSAEEPLVSQFRGLWMSILSNFKIRTKILIALLPLVVMVAAAGIYSSIEMKKIDTQYSELMDRDLGALQAITFAQSTNNLFNLFLYKEIAETNPDQIRVVDAGVDSAVDDFRASADDAVRRLPRLSAELDPIVQSF